MLIAKRFSPVLEFNFFLALGFRRCAAESAVGIVCIWTGCIEVTKVVIFLRIGRLLLLLVAPALVSWGWRTRIFGRFGVVRCSMWLHGLLKIYKGFRLSVRVRQGVVFDGWWRAVEVVFLVIVGGVAISAHTVVITGVACVVWTDWWCSIEIVFVEVVYLAVISARRGLTA